VGWSIVTGGHWRRIGECRRDRRPWDDGRAAA
jgi:hypothetical protein